MPLGDSYWRRENLLLESIYPGIENLVSTDMRGFVNELAFIAFSNMRDDKVQPAPSVEEAIQIAIPAAISYINRLIKPTILTSAEVDGDCIKEATLLLLSLGRMFPETIPATFRPKFQGCGILGACEGDLVFGECLYEIKAGARAFRMADLKQLLVYSALSYAEDSRIFKFVGLCNPRTGAHWVRDLDSVCYAISGLSASDVLSNLTKSFESADTYQI